MSVSLNKVTDTRVPSHTFVNYPAHVADAVADRLGIAHQGHVGGVSLVKASDYSDGYGREYSVGE